MKRWIVAGAVGVVVLGTAAAWWFADPGDVAEPFAASRGVLVADDAPDAQPSAPVDACEALAGVLPDAEPRGAVGTCTVADDHVTIEVAATQTDVVVFTETLLDVSRRAGVLAEVVPVGEGVGTWIYDLDRGVLYVHRGGVGMQVAVTTTRLSREEALDTARRVAAQALA